MCARGILCIFLYNYSSVRQSSCMFSAFCGLCFCLPILSKHGMGDGGMLWMRIIIEEGFLFVFVMVGCVICGGGSYCCGRNFRHVCDGWMHEGE